MKRTKALFVLLASLVVLSFTACASSSGRVTSSVTAGSPDDPFSVTVLSYNDVRSLYGTFMHNPYLAPSSSIMPTYNDYVVLKLAFNLPVKARLQLLQANASDEKGKVYADYMTREKFTDFAMTQSPDQASNAEKRNKIEWYYLPSVTMDLKTGKQTYLLVLVGKHPIPDTATIHVAVSFDDNATSFDIPVPISND